MEKKWRKKISINNKVMEFSRFVYIQVHEFIPDGFEIHHLNGNELDNRIENLQCLSRSEHKKIHAKDRKRNLRLNSEHKNSIRKGLLNYYSKNPVWNKGIPSMTEDNKRKLIEINKVRDYTLVGKKISKSKLGHSVSKETREKIRNTLKGRILSLEHRKHISEGNYKRWGAWNDSKQQEFSDRKLFDGGKKWQ